MKVPSRCENAVWKLLLHTVMMPASTVTQPETLFVASIALLITQSTSALRTIIYSISLWVSRLRIGQRLGNFQLRLLQHLQMDVLMIDVKTPLCSSLMTLKTLATQRPTA
jgi:hypothetical protein